MADTKTTALTANTAPLSTDIMYMVDDPGGSPLSQKMTLATLKTFVNTFSGARYNSNAATAIASGSAAIVDFEDVVYDTDSAVTTGASWKYTAPATGYYHVSFYISFQSNGAWGINERVLAILTVNTVDTVQLDRWEAHATNNSLIPTVTGSTTIALTAAQYISITINQNSGSNLSISSSATACWICIDRLA